MSRLCGVLWLLMLTPLASGDDWPTFMRDGRRGGVSAEVVDATRLTSLWVAELSPESVDGSPAVVGDRVYVGTASGSVWCLETVTGKRIWRVAFDGAVTSSPTVVGQLVFVGSGDRCAYALDAATGKTVWQVRTRGAVVASPLTLDDTVCFGSMDGVFRCIQAETGKLRWSVALGGAVSAAAAAADGTVYFGDEDGNLSARRLTDGAEIWSRKTKGAIVAAPSVVGDSVLVPVMSSTALQPPATDCLTVCDRATGEVRWTVNWQSSVLHTPVADDRNVYFATVSGYLSDTELLAVRLSDGNPVWKQRLGGVADSSPVRIGSVLLVGSHDGKLCVVDTRDGRLIKTIDIGAKMFSSPAVSGGRVFIGAQDGKLHCLQ